MRPPEEIGSAGKGSAHLTNHVDAWKAGERAIVTGDAAALEELLRQHGEMLRERLAPEYDPGGLRPDYARGDAQAILLHEHQFETWEQFVEYLKQRAEWTSPVARFEAAADAIVAGDSETLGRLLRENPGLIRARSTRVHRATLLHYIGGNNGGEAYRQKCPGNAPEIAKMLIDAGAEIDARAGMYGGLTTLGSVATDIHPFLAGVVEKLMEMLLDAGARMDAGMVHACLANGRPWAAELLARRGARLDLEGAAGVGRLDLVRSFFNEDGSLKPNATKEQMKDGFTWACEFGKAGVVEFLLDRGMEIDARLRHHGQTGLHWAAGGGHVETVKVLLNRKAPVNAKDETWQNTPLGWALFGWRNPPWGGVPGNYHEVVGLLVKFGAIVEPEWLASEAIRADPRMLSALLGEVSS